MSDDDSTLEIYLSHRSALVDYATPIVGCPARAEDVVQDAYLRYAPAVSRGEVRQPVGYLYRVVRNLALDCVRALGSGNRPQSYSAAVEEVPDETASPERRAVYRDELRVVAQALSELPMRTQLAFEMHRFGGMTLHEIAARLAISVTLAHQLIRAALTHCADRLAESDGALQ